MRIPIQSAHVERTAFETGAHTGSSSVVGAAVLPQFLRARFRAPNPLLCYARCRGAGANDLFCRFSCDLRPFTIGGLLLAE